MIAYAGKAGVNAKIVLLNANDALSLIKTIQTTISEIYEVDFSYDNTKLLVCGKRPMGRGYDIYEISTSNLLISVTTGYVD